MPNRRTRQAAIVLTLAASLAACGSTDGAADAVPQSDPTPTDAAATEVVTTEVTTTAPAPDEPVQASIVASTRSQPIVVDVGGAPPTDPEVDEIHRELEAHLTANGIPTEPAQLFAHFAADRWVHVFIDNAWIESIAVIWSAEGPDAGRLNVTVRYLLDGAGLDDTAVADAIEEALSGLGLEPFQRWDNDPDEVGGINLDYGPNGGDQFDVTVVGPRDGDAPGSSTFRISTHATFDDVPPQVIEPVAPIVADLDQLDPDGPIIQIETGIKNNPFPYVVRQLERLTTVAPDDFDGIKPS